MPISPDLLNPIAGPNPGGANLRYDPVYDKIKEARREDDDAPQGDWAREQKKADWPLVIKLCSDAIQNKSKDLQLAAWLTEAVVCKEGFGGLRQGLDLCKALVEGFWDNLYPEIEDDDLELRAAPLEWIGGRLDDKLKKVPITKTKLDWYKYKQSRSVGYEADVGDSEQKREARDQAVTDGKMTAEEFDKDFEATPKQFYVDAVADLNACSESVEALAATSEAKFQSFAPSFAGIRQTLEEVRAAFNILLNRKRETEPDEDGGSVAADDATEAGSEEAVSTGGGAAAAPARKKMEVGEPVDRNDAIARIADLCAWMRKQDAYNPVPYLVARSLQWGELRVSGAGTIDSSLLKAPTSEMRTRVKSLIEEGNYEEALNNIEAAMAQPCGRAWLDLQRYFCTACDSAGGYDYVKTAVVTEFKLLLADFPELPKMTLSDDTPTANYETQKWIESLSPQPSEAVAEEAPMLDAAPGADSEPAAGETRPPDVFELAKQAVQEGRAHEGVEMLAREAATERSGRARFQRRVQLAQMCLAADRESMARTILEGLAEEIDSRKLQDWETPEMLAHALALLYRCVSKMKDSPELKQTLYARICRLDPGQALELTK